MQRQLARLAARQDAVLTRRDVLAAGGDDALLRRLARAGQWEPLLRGSHLAEPWRVGTELQRSWARSAVLAVRGAVVGHGTAAALHGLQGVPRTGLVDLVVDRHVDRGGRRLNLVQSALGAHHVVDLQGIPATSAVRTLADLVPRLGRLEALAVLDSALHLGLVDAAGLRAAAALAAGHRGCTGALDLWSLADGRAESPLESRARLLCLDAGLVPVALQLVVRDAEGCFVARSDLAFERRDPSQPPLLLEADGAGPHSTPDALYRDRWRANALAALGHPVVRVTWADTCRPGTVPAVVRAVL